ncbi:MAG: 2OG-Fe(II) oxygenase [Pseudomonadota bacterium]
MNNTESTQKYVSDQKIHRTNHILQEDLLNLLNGNYAAITISGYYNQTLSSKIADRILKRDINYYKNAPDIGRVGIAYFEVENNPNTMLKYYQQALPSIKILRDIFDPYISPLDKLRLDLQETWQAGANLENIHGQQMFVGLCRVMEPGIDVLPHQDILRRDAKDVLSAYSLEKQLAANIYLQVPEKGGELELWLYSATDQEYEQLRSAGSYGVPREKLPKATIQIKPNIGELILFDATQFHAVRPSIGTSRLSISCFIGYRGAHRPLTYWS